MVKHVEENDFNEVVLESEQLVLVDFWATWCGPCKMVAPILEQLSEEMSNVTFAKVDVDNNPNLADKYEIASIPTIMLFKNGEMVNKVTGFRPKSELLDLINRGLQA
ncbi:thioredoxin [Clostridium manihotivorum]|uniref:Thioredoxin n=1 Tax=Clostridium manihotivorum TaxID=2320868 RepID=A0A410DPA5_9CLOT|nr:thioredoxin [Clostridium manihotivorum]QAA30888.1 thioredoxin [Clostridium manihotivorum]